MQRMTFIGASLSIALLTSIPLSQAQDVQDSNNQKKSDSTTIDQILVSDIPNAQGYVLTNKSVLPPHAAKIYATVQLGSAVEGSIVMATLIYLPTQSKIGPVVAKISTTGNTMEAFSFTNTKMPWPKGIYEIDASTASGDSQKITFTIEDTQK